MSKVASKLMMMLRIVYIAVLYTRRLCT